jgi:hypothetical protein
MSLTAPETPVVVYAEDDHEELERFTIPTSLVRLMNAVTDEWLDPDTTVIYEIPRLLHYGTIAMIAHPASPYHSYRDVTIDAIQQGLGRSFTPEQMS